MLLFFIFVLGFWVGIGLLLLFLYGRSKGSTYQRTVEANYCEMEEPVSVTLDLTPPSLEGPVDDHDMVLAIDHSGSMGAGPGSPLRDAIRAAKNFIRRLPTNIHAGIVAFSHEAQLLSPITEQEKKVLRDIASISPGGGTAIHEALDRCREGLVDSRADVNKTVVLLSDGNSSRSAATQAAERLQDAVPNVTIITVGFGDGVNEQLMTELASEERFYIHVDESEDLYDLFHHLSKVISGKIAISGLVSEQVRAPHPVRLEDSTGLVPSGVHLEENTKRVVWQAPVMDPRSLRLQYEVAPLCPGWYPVATQEGTARWTMPDGTERTDSAPDGPRLLVLPKRWGWAWWLLNPLFWLLVDRFWTCEPPETPTDDSDEEPEPLDEEVPEPLPAPPDSPYKPDPQPALVIGLGDVGRRTLCDLKWHLSNRDVPPSRVDVMSLDVLHPANQSDNRRGSVPLTSDERLPLHQDLRPYLEDLRTQSLQDEGIPLSRRWIPWREWLADTEPLSTVRSLDDRRKARLALLLQPDTVEDRLEQQIERIRREEGQIIVTGSPSEPELSGMAAEVAHICATSHEAVTVVFAPSDAADVGTQAFFEEVERMMRENGTGVLSDRGSQDGTSTVSARRLFDRFILASPDDVPSADRSKATADLLWCMLAYGDDLDIPPLEPDDLPIQGTRIQYSAILPPAGILWEWIREDRLAQSINETWLNLEVQQGEFSLPSLDQDVTQQDIEAFWTGRYNDRPLNRVIARSRSILQEESPTETVLGPSVSEATDQPGLVQISDRPYHEQADFCETQREMFANYLTEWAHQILGSERDNRRCGLQRLWVALNRVEEEIAVVLDAYRDHDESSPFSDTAQLAADLFADFETTRSTLARDVHCWLSYFIGSSPKLELKDLHVDKTPMSYDIEEARKEALHTLSPSEEVREEAREAWDDRLESINEKLQFAVENKPDQRDISLRLNFADESFDCRSDIHLAENLRTKLNRYRPYILEWVNQTQFPIENAVSDPDSRSRIGSKDNVFPTVDTVRNDEDPLVAAALAVEEKPLESLLGIAGRIEGPPPYAWPEEANALRLKNKIRNILHREPEFPSSAAHLLRNARGLFGFMSDIARGNLRMEGHEYRLVRDGEVFVLDQDLDTNLDSLITLAEQAVLIQKDHRGDPLPSHSSWKVEPEEAVEAVDESALGQHFSREQGWERWKDLIRGLALEHGEQGE